MADGQSYIDFPDLFSGDSVSKATNLLINWDKLRFTAMPRVTTVSNSNTKNYSIRFSNTIYLIVQSNNYCCKYD